MSDEDSQPACFRRIRSIFPFCCSVEFLKEILIYSQSSETALAQAMQIKPSPGRISALRDLFRAFLIFEVAPDCADAVAALPGQRFAGVADQGQGERVAMLERIGVRTGIGNFHGRGAAACFVVLQREPDFAVGREQGQNGLHAQLLRDRQDAVHQPSADHMPEAEILDFGEDRHGIRLGFPEDGFEDLQAVDELTGLAFLRRGEDFLRGSLLVDDALIHKEHAVRDIPGKAHFMGHNQHRQAVPGELPDDGKHFADHGRIQGGGRLVKQDDLRIHRDGADDGDALLLAAGELGGEAERLVRQSDHPQELHALPAGFLPAAPEELRLGQHQVFDHGQMGKEVEGLEDHADLLPHAVDVISPGAGILPFEQD